MEANKTVIQQIKPYDKPEWRRGISQLVSTVLLSVVFWTVSVAAFRMYPLLTPIPGAVLSLLTVRLFILFHDCTHNSFTPSLKANRIIGYLLGILTFTSYDDWRKSHGIHHSSNGDLNKRGIGDVWLLTVAEYESLPVSKKILYRVFRNWFVLLFLVPPILFLIVHRFPGRHSSGKEKAGVLLTDAGIVLMMVLLSGIMGFKTYLVLQLSVFYGASVVGLWLFFVQHNFIPGYWVRTDAWTRTDSALKGSSFLKLNPLLNWFSGSIGYHHIHHLNPHIPNYNLVACQKGVRALDGVPPVRLPSALGFVKIKLWDERSGEYTDFKLRPVGRRPL